MKRVLALMMMIACMAACACAQESGMIWAEDVNEARAAYADCVLMSSLQEHDYLALVMEQPDGRQFIVCGVKRGARMPFRWASITMVRR